MIRSLVTITMCLVASLSFSETLETVTQRLSELQKQREALYSDINTTRDSLATVENNLLNKDTAPAAIREAFIKAKAAVDSAKASYADEPSLMKKAQLDKLLFKQKVAEQDFQKLESAEKALKDKQLQLRGKEQQLRDSLQMLDASISVEQQRINVLLTQKIQEAAQQTTSPIVATQVDSVPENTAVAEPTAPAYPGNYAVIVNPSVSGDTSDAELKNLFLGKRRSLASINRADPVNLPASDSTYAAFCNAVLGMNERKLGAYWSKVLFSGKAERPKELQDAQAVIRYVSENESAVAYIPVEALNDDVKALYFF